MERFEERKGGEVSSVHHRAGAGAGKDAKAKPRRAEHLPVEYPTAMAAPVNSEALSRSTALKFETENAMERERGEGVRLVQRRKGARLILADGGKGGLRPESSSPSPRPPFEFLSNRLPEPRRALKAAARSRSSTLSEPSLRCVQQLTYCLERRGRVQDFVLGFVKYHSHDSLLPLTRLASPTYVFPSTLKKLWIVLLSLSVSLSVSLLSRPWRGGEGKRDQRGRGMRRIMRNDEYTEGPMVT